MSSARRVPWLLTGALLAVASCVSSSALELYETSDAPCYDRALEPQTTVVDAHLHFRPFGGPEIPFEELVSYLEETGVLFANVYGIGQTLPDSSSCTYYLDCPGTPLTPSLDNDLANAAEYVTNPPSRVHLTMSMTFPDLARPATILPAMQRLDLDRRSAGVGGVPRVHIDIGVLVHGIAIPMCAPPIPHVAGGVAVAPRPQERRCRSRGCGRGGSDPPLSMPGTASGRVGCARPSTLRWEVAPVQQSRAGRPSVTWDGCVPNLAAWAVARAIGGTPALLGDARLPDGRPVGERVIRRLDAALKPPSRVGIDGSGATPRDGGRGVKTHLRPSPHQALGLGGRSHLRLSGPSGHGRPGRGGVRRANSIVIYCHIRLYY